jgi:hypothetical protein
MLRRSRDRTRDALKRAPTCPYMPLHAPTCPYMPLHAPRCFDESDFEDDFAELLAGFEVGVGGGGFGQREDAINDGFQAAGGD